MRKRPLNCRGPFVRSETFEAKVQSLSREWIKISGKILLSNISRDNVPVWWSARNGADLRQVWLTAQPVQYRPACRLQHSAQVPALSKGGDGVFHHCYLAVPVQTFVNVMLLLKRPHSSQGYGWKYRQRLLFLPAHPPHLQYHTMKCRCWWAAQ